MKSAFSNLFRGLALVVLVVGKIKIALIILALSQTLTTRGQNYCQYNDRFIRSQEPTPVYLGYVIDNQFHSESIINTFGSYGSSFSSTSIRNSFSAYGSSYSMYSAYNKLASAPPIIYYYLGSTFYFVAYLTKNVLKTPRVDPDVLIAALQAGCGVTAPTRIIRLTGDLAFGNVTVGSSATRTLTIYNDGNGTLSVSSISYPSGFSGAWSGTIAAGGSRAVTVTFSPGAAQGYSGTITVNSDMTSGANTRSCSGVGVSSEGAVYRFWSPTMNSHFFTTSLNEKNHIIANWQNDWSYEGVAWYVHTSQVAGSTPVYRFWSPVFRKHFFTISLAERNHIISTWPTVWIYEGISWYAYTSQVAGASPVYRFWSPVLRGHFYTISSSERNHIIATWPDTWTYEGIAYYAFTASPAAPSVEMFVTKPTSIISEAIDPSGDDDSKADSSGRKVSSWRASKLEATDAAEGSAIYYPFNFSNTYVAAMVYDSLSATWLNVLPATLSPSGILLPSVPLDHRFWLAVLSHDETTDSWTLEHGSWFGRLSVAPEVNAISTNHSEVATEVGLPIETFVLPDTASTVSVQVYSMLLKKYVEVISGLPGGSRYDFRVSDWNHWYRVDFFDETDGSIMESQWFGHERMPGIH